VNTNLHPEPPANQLPDAEEATRRAADAAKVTVDKVAVTARDMTIATKDAMLCASDKVKEMYHSAALKAEETLDTSKEYVRRNPVPVLLGAIAFGAAIGYMVVMSRRKPTFGERYADEPLSAVREAILGALAPVTQRVHDGYDSAREGAEKVIDRFGSGRHGSSFSHQIGRIGNNLKFW